MIHRARKRFGQHFLEPAWCAKVVEACRPLASDAFVEIGPGTGALTLPLAARVGRVLAVEIDRNLAATLEKHGLANLTVHTGDVLDADLDALLDGWAGPDRTSAIRVVGNLPYNISSPILFMLAALSMRRPGLVDATLMVQAEVADRLVAQPRTGEYGVLTLMAALTAEVERLFELPPGAFRPRPKVRSALVRLRFRTPPFPILNRDTLVRLVRMVFTQRRKTIANGLRAAASGAGVDAGAILAAAGIDPMRRPETLQLVEFAALADAWQAAGAAPPVL
ncbi:MAG TPA: 16S rRNA (adenine(1518)-N(6)/adenine(1519)-N(6))-dimethyltransferase RsmA [Vicinamibacterales bacterium]|nr:16S rRNA (adenine(1518)-N(6)/adenine(1519)-N(6))-dimethyltransferase RsmA [Vicinamibacterales bacterium]